MKKILAVIGVLAVVAIGLAVRNSFKTETSQPQPRQINQLFHASGTVNMSL